MPYSIDTLLQPTGLWPLFPDMVIKGTMLLLLTFAAVVVLRRASAATRNFAWGLGLAILILLPLVPAVMPWRVGLLPPAAPRGAGAETPLRSDRDGEPASDAGDRSAGDAVGTVGRRIRHYVFPH